MPVLVLSFASRGCRADLGYLERILLNTYKIQIVCPNWNRIEQFSTESRKRSTKN